MSLTRLHVILVWVIIGRLFYYIGIRWMLDGVSSTLGDFPLGLIGIFIEDEADLNVVACFRWCGGCCG